MTRDAAPRREELVSFLRGTEFFGGFSNGQLGRIADICSQRAYAAGSVIFNESSDSREVFVLKEGKVSIRFRCAIRGQDVSLYALREGQLFGWSGLWDDVERTASAIATEDSTCLVMAGPDLQDLYKDDYGLGYRFMERLSALIADRLVAVKMHYLELDETE